MAVPVLFDLDRIEGIRKLLQEAPERSTQRVTRPQAIRSLATDIAQIQSKGYSVGEIAAMLTEQGLEVSTGGLQTYLRDARRLARGKGRKRKPAGAATARDGTEVRPKAAPGPATGAAPEDPSGGEPRTRGGSLGSAAGGPPGGGTGRRPGGSTGYDVGSPPKADSAARGPSPNANEGAAVRPNIAQNGAPPAPAWSFTPREDSDDL